MHSECSTYQIEGIVSLNTLINPVDITLFQSAVCRLDTLFSVYAGTCPSPIPAPALIITSEIRSQCERYLPISCISSLFKSFYSAALSYRPVFSSTPFYNSLSWADTFTMLPAEFQRSANPARLLESLLTDSALLTRFIFTSFLPNRFYGRLGRYPGQQNFIRKWLMTRKVKKLDCLDTACGTGEDTYYLAFLLSETGFTPESVYIEGWTLDPLEVWAAEHRRFPHDQRREELLREITAPVFTQGYGAKISFHCHNILSLPPQDKGTGKLGFDLILCNGLLGGPIIHDRQSLSRVIRNLAQLLNPGGMLLAADHFHGGWKQKCPQSELRASFEANYLKSFAAGEGIGGLKSDQ